MPQDTTNLAILFADIAKSTQLYEKMGDNAAQNVIGTCLACLADITQKYKGTVIKTIGDEIMCTFPVAENAVEAAKEMHQELEQITLPDQPNFIPPNIYVGIQAGPVVMEDNDVFGDAVNVAARMVSLAKQRQILTTEEVIETLSPENQESSRRIDRTTIKGKSGAVDIYEVIWEQHDVTIMMDETLDQFVLKTSLELSFAGNSFKVDQLNPSATLGRQTHNDVVVNDNRVSRSHARIEFRRGKFILIDQSTNGTFVSIQGKKNIQLKRDETQLHGHGIIQLGRDVEEGSPYNILYTIKF